MTLPPVTDTDVQTTSMDSAPSSNVTTAALASEETVPDPIVLPLATNRTVTGSSAPVMRIRAHANHDPACAVWEPMRPATVDPDFEPVVYSGTISSLTVCPRAGAR